LFVARCFLLVELATRQLARSKPFYFWRRGRNNYLSNRQGNSFLQQKHQPLKNNGWWDRLVGPNWTYHIDMFFATDASRAGGMQVQ